MKRESLSKALTLPKNQKESSLIDCELNDDTHRAISSLIAVDGQACRAGRQFDMTYVDVG